MVQRVEERRAISHLQCDFAEGDRLGYHKCDKPSHQDCNKDDFTRLKTFICDSMLIFRRCLCLYGVKATAVDEDFTLDVVESLQCVRR